MADASLKQVGEFFSTSAKPIRMQELKDLTSEDKTELKALVGEELGL